MHKFIYWIGIYAICAYTHDTFGEIQEYAARELHKRSKQSEDKRNRSVNLSTDKIGDPINRIGF